MPEERAAIINEIGRLLKTGGYYYIAQFAQTWSSPVYKKRYEDGIRKGYERGTFEKVTEARSKAINAGTVKEQGQAENMLTGALKSLFAVVENYPDLKANQNFLMLQEELAGTEGKIAYARQFYNDIVMKFNLRQQVFPSNIIANMFNFKEKEYFEIEEEEAREPVKVKF